MHFSALNTPPVRSLQFGNTHADAVGKTVSDFRTAFAGQGGDINDLRLRPIRRPNFNLVEVFALASDIPKVTAAFDAMNLGTVEDAALYHPGATCDYRVNAEGVKFIITPDAKGGACDGGACSL